MTLLICFFVFTGALPPVGFFDPLGLSEGKTDGAMKKIREAELKHGRLAMVATLGILVGEKFNPFFDGKISGPAIYQFQQADEILPVSEYGLCSEDYYSILFL